MVAKKVNDLTDGRFSVPTVLDYYNRLNGDDTEITALINSICGGEPSLGGAAVSYVKVKMLDDVETFIGSDLMPIR